MDRVPDIATDRTIMRPWRADDLDAAAAWMSDAEVMRFVGGVADRAGAWRAIATYLGHWQLRGYGLWAVQRQSDGVLLGRVGLWNPEGWPGIEVGWTLARHAWGQGFATECGQAAIAWAWANLPELNRLLSVIDPVNLASQRVAGRLGMEVLGPYRLRGEIDTLLYGLDRPGPG